MLMIMRRLRRRRKRRRGRRKRRYSKAGKTRSEKYLSRWLSGKIWFSDSMTNRFKV